MNISNYPGFYPPPSQNKGFPAVIHRVIVNETTLVFGSYLSNKGKWNLPLPEFPFHQRNISFQCGAPFFEQESAALFRYQLDGYSPDWTGWIKESRKHYTNLEPGEYTFHVQAKNVYDVTSREDAFSFRVLPPWYRTWWAYGIYGIALVIAFNFAVKWRSRKVIREKEKLEQALRENPPRLLFLSGSNTAKTPGDTTGRTGVDIPGTTAEGSFARLMAESHRVPAVLGWGHYMTDAPAIFAAKILFKELSRGRSILDAVQRVRFELQEEFHGPGQGSWAFLRLYGDGTAMTALVKNNQNQQPGPRKMKHIYFQRFYLRNITG